MSPLVHECSFQSPADPDPTVRALRTSGEAGFTLVEVVVAVSILMVGLLAMAALDTKMLTSGRSSKYMSQASILASEKLEDLNRWDQDDPHVCLPVATPSVGSLAADVRQTTTCSGGNNASVNYYDDVNLSFLDGGDCPDATGGCVAETISSEVAGATVYTTTYHAPDGNITMVTTNNPPVGATFHRRWIIEGDQPVAGVRRITLLVTLLDLSVRPAVNFQMSVVRP